jgi:hypothetical protein
VLVFCLATPTKALPEALGLFIGFGFWDTSTFEAGRFRFEEGFPPFATAPDLFCNASCKRAFAWAIESGFCWLCLSGSDVAISGASSFWSAVVTGTSGLAISSGLESWSKPALATWLTLARSLPSFAAVSCTGIFSG